MSQQPSPYRDNSGFTLIEMTIALVVTAILGVILVTALGSSLTNSSQPIFRLQQTMALLQTMENIRADFTVSNDLALLKTAIGTGVQSNSYGNYEVLENAYVKFAGYTEAPGVASDGILKVTIRDSTSGMVLTELFVDW